MGSSGRYTAYYAPTWRMAKYLQPSSVITQLQSGHGWTSNGTGVTSNLNNTTAGLPVIGTQCASLTTGGGGAQSNLRKFAGTIPDTAGKAVRLRVRCDDITHLNELDFYLGTSSLGSNYKWQFHIQGASALVTSGDWVTVVLNFGDATTTGTPARSGLTDAQLQAWDDNTGNAVTVHLQSVELIPDPSATYPNGVVSVCFDDAYQSVWDLLKPRLDLYGYPASVYAIGDIVGTGVGAAARLTWSELRALQDLGWEISGHAATDADHATTLTSMTAAQVDSDLRALKASLRDQGLHGDGLAYPLGQFGRTVDGQPTGPIVERYFAYARTTASRTKHEHTIPGDPLRIRGLSGISTFAGGITPTSLTTATTGVLDVAKANASWVVLVFHQGTTGTVDATTKLLQSDFNAIVDKVNSNGTPVMTVADVLRG